MLLRPRTGLQDMVIELDPGSDDAPTVPEGFTIPLANSAPNVNFDQILASLDGDTRAYLRLLLAGGAEALGTPEKSERFASVLRRLEPTTRDLAKVNGALAERRKNLRRVITNFKLIAEEVGRPTPSSPTSSPPRTRSSAPSPSRRPDPRDPARPARRPAGDRGALAPPATPPRS